ncbi:unnamed protein product [Rotaria sordida]|uniref:Secreted protein n=1 Tax=Rotaria sordida TaxID=392033 RepID=A0A813U4U0_9BILA|nr:unnamed protein product [Rotaria sordida]CAF3745614.1 unnamed protein product [Rotaria sordida]
MIDRKLLFGLILVLLSTSYDLTRSYLSSVSTETNTSESTSTSFNSDSEQEYEQSSSIPPPKIKKQAVQTIKFLFCHS